MDVHKRKSAPIFGFVRKPCINEHRGCKWTGPPAHLGEHLLSGCTVAQQKAESKEAALAQQEVRRGCRWWIVCCLLALVLGAVYYTQFYDDGHYDDDDADELTFEGNAPPSFVNTHQYDSPNDPAFSVGDINSRLRGGQAEYDDQYAPPERYDPSANPRVNPNYQQNNDARGYAAVTERTPANDDDMITPTVALEATKDDIDEVTQTPKPKAAKTAKTTPAPKASKASKSSSKMPPKSAKVSVKSPSKAKAKSTTKETPLKNDASETKRRLSVLRSLDEYGCDAVKHLKVVKFLGQGRQKRAWLCTFKGIELVLKKPYNRFETTGKNREKKKKSKEHRIASWRRTVADFMEEVDTDRRYSNVEAIPKVFGVCTNENGEVPRWNEIIGNETLSPTLFELAEYGVRPPLNHVKELSWLPRLRIARSLVYSFASMFQPHETPIRCKPHGVALSITRPGQPILFDTDFDTRLTFGYARPCHGDLQCVLVACDLVANLRGHLSEVTCNKSETATKSYYASLPNLSKSTRSKWEKAVGLSNLTINRTPEAKYSWDAYQRVSVPKLMHWNISEWRDTFDYWWGTAAFNGVHRHAKGFCGRLREKWFVYMIGWDMLFKYVPPRVSQIYDVHRSTDLVPYYRHRGVWSQWPNGTISESFDNRLEQHAMRLLGQITHLNADERPELNDIVRQIDWLISQCEKRVTGSELC